jgi:hypothetical protein
MIELHGHQAVSRNLEALTVHGPDPSLTTQTLRHAVLIA